MNICPAKPFDISTIMSLERSAFIPSIQESQKVFEERLSVFPEGFLLLQIDGKTAGYFCSEIWSSVPREDSFFELGHSAKKLHDYKGPVLYASSFAIFNEFRGKKLGRPFFEGALKSICGAFPYIQTVLLLVNEEWKGARHIYESLGFTELRTISGFFPGLTSPEADGILMTCPAQKFRN